MRWKQAELYGKIQTGEDELKNPVYENLRICDFWGRFTPWSIEEITSLGNTYTLCRRKLLTRSSVSAFRGKWDWNTFSFVKDEIPQTYEHCTVIIDGDTYTIENIKKLNEKFTVLTIKAVKL